MPADTTKSDKLKIAEAHQQLATADERQSILASRVHDFDSMTVGQLAQMIEEMQRMIVSIGAHLESRTQLESRHQSRVGEVLDQAEIENLAAMLSAIERVRAA